MFLDSRYILANELIEKMDIHIANISILYKSLSHLNHCPILKLNSLSFINKKSALFPKNITEYLQNEEFTNMGNKLPCNYVSSQYNLTKKELIKNELITDCVKISNKRFYVFDDNFVKKMKNKVPYILNYKETMQCYKNKQIDGYIKLKSNKFLTWY